MSSNNSNSGNRPRIDRFLLALILPGLIAALFLASGRLHMENSSRNVELTLDYTELQNLSISTGVSISDILKQFKTAGITGVAVGEDLLGTLVDTGQATYEQRSSDAGPLTVLRIRDKQLAVRVWESLNARMMPGMISPQITGDVNTGNVPDAIIIRAAPASLATIGIGLPDDAVRIVENSGLDVIGRIVNHPALTKKAIDASISDLKRYGIDTIICAGEEVFGFRGLITYAADSFLSGNLIYGSVEFAKQRGDAGMCSALKGNFIRVHSIPYAEMAGMAPSTAVERFTRAVKERSIRLCYMRLPATSGEAPLEDALSFIQKTRSSIEGAGYMMGTAQPFEPVSRPIWALGLIVLSIAAGAVMLLNSAMTLSPAVKYGLLIAGAVAVMAILILMGEKGIQMAALLSALIFPTLGVAALAGPYFNTSVGEKAPMRKAALIFIGASAFTLCGAMLIVGLLADRTYAVKMNQFVGVKFAHLLPMLMIGFAMVAGLPIFNKPFAQVRDEAIGNIRRLIAHPLFVWHVVAVFTAIGIIGFALLRTGNDPGVGVSGLEIQFRSILDKLLVVRPRTKEFLIGHPAMFLGIALLLTKRRAWGLPLLAFGMIGQVSLLNTFCHIHTPLSISLHRAANGLVIGLLISIVAWFLLERRLNSTPSGKV
ncbi:MAG: DUF5693 family protein [Armatimonadota bacterium]